MVAGSLLTQFTVIGTMFAYGVFFKELEAEFGWSRTLLSAASSAAMLMMGILAFLAGRLNDNLGPRWVLTGSGLMFGLGYALMAAMHSPWQLIVLYGCFVGIGLATHDVVTLSTIARWFPKKRGMMTGIVKTGTGFGQIVLPPVAAILAGAMGWRMACLALGLGAAFILVAAAQLMRNPAVKTDPENLSEPGSASNAATIAASTSTSTSMSAPVAGRSFRQVAKTRHFWLLCAIQAVFFPVLTTIPLHIVAHGTDLGMTSTTAAGILSVIGATSIAGRLVVGAGVDRLGGRNAYLMCFVMLLTSLLILRFSSASHWLFVFAAFYGLAHGGFFTVVSPTIAEYFDMKAHSSVFGAIVFFGTIGGATGPLLAGLSFDTNGSYALAFSILIGLAVLGLILVAALGRPALTQPAGTAAPA